MRFETFVAGRFLKIKNQRKLVPLITILATLGVIVGVMVLIVVIAVMSGFQSELKRRILGIEPHIMVLQYSNWLNNYNEDIKKILKIDGVASAAPYIYTQGMLRSAHGLSAVVLKGLDPQRTDIQLNIKGSKTIQQLLSETVSDTGSPSAGIVLGSVLADKLDVSVGDSLLIMVAGADRSDPSVLPRQQQLRVEGLFETGMYQYDGTMGFMNIGELQQMIGVNDLVTGIEVKVKDVDQVELVSRLIITSFGIEYWATDWKQMHRNLFSMLRLQKMMMFVILTLIIIVAAFNIASALIMMVKEKVKDIAILKVMGANRRSIRAIFLSKGMVIGLTGICIGVCGGLLLCLFLSQYPFISLPGDVYFLTTLPVKIDIVDLAMIVLGTFLICAVASVYPAVRAAKMKPVDGVRYG